MARKVRAYTDIGWRIARLGKRQHEIARVLGVSQQTVSKKLRGETAIFYADLQALAKHYKVPLTYFVEEEEKNPDLAKAFLRISRTEGPLQELAILISRLRSADVQRMLEIAKVIRSPGDVAKIAAESKAPYGKK